MMKTHSLLGSKLFQQIKVLLQHFNAPVQPLLNMFSDPTLVKTPEMNGMELPDCDRQLIAKELFTYELQQDQAQSRVTDTSARACKAKDDFPST
jgi:hypothetical protein